MKLEGEIAEIDLIERLVELWREQFTGAIRFENDGIIKIIYFKGGDVLSASTNDRADSVDEILMRAGKVTREHVKQALSKRKENETLGDALLNLGFITRKELTWARRVQVIGVIRSIIAWDAGSYTIVADYLPKREEGTLFALPQVLVELIVTEQDRGRFERLLDGGAIVYDKTPEFDDAFRRLGLNEDADAIAAAIDGTRSAADVASVSGRETFNVYKLIHALATLGILRRVEPQVTPQVSFEDDSFASVGVADAADALDITPIPGLAEPSAAPAADWDALPHQQPSAIPTDWSVDGPSFELGDIGTPAPQPTLEVPALDQTAAYEYEAPAYEPPAYEAPAYEPEPEPSFAPEPDDAPQMPAWDAPVRPPVVPVTAKPEPAAAEEGWGFDEAQIETARAAAVPEPVAETTAVRRQRVGMAPPPKSDSRFAIIVSLIVIGAVFGLGYGAWFWYQKQQEKPVAPIATTRPRPARRPRPATDTTGTIVSATDTNTTVALTLTGTETMSTAAPATTTTVATTTTIATTTTTPPVTASVAPTPAPVPAPSSPLPRVTPRTTPATSTVVVGRTPQGGAVITNAPAGSSATRDRYDAMAREFARNASGNYTVQFAIICEPSNIAKSMNAGGANVWFVPISYRGKSCYRVFWGRYDTRDAASAGIGQLPSSIRGSSPVVVSVPKG